MALQWGRNEKHTNRRQTNPFCLAQIYMGKNIWTGSTFSILIVTCWSYFYIWYNTCNYGFVSFNFENEYHITTWYVHSFLYVDAYCSSLIVLWNGWFLIYDVWSLLNCQRLEWQNIWQDNNLLCNIYQRSDVTETQLSLNERYNSPFITLLIVSMSRFACLSVVIDWFTTDMYNWCYCGNSCV